VSQRATLGSVADFVNGYGFNEGVWAASGRPIIRIQNLTDQSKPFNYTEYDPGKRFHVVEGDILVSWSATLDVFVWRGPDAYLNQHIFKVLPDYTRVDKSYLIHALCNAIASMSSVTRGSTMKHVNRGDFLNTEIFLPSLDAQQRIAAILDKADSLRCKRQEAIRLADDLLRATLLTCLEQPYDALVVEQLLSVKKNAIRTGPFGSQLLHAEFTESGVPVLGIDNVVTNRFRWDERRYISSDKYEQLSRYTVYPGDVMVTIMGTTGRVAVAPDDLPICISTKHLCTMTVDRTKILPEFLWACLLWDPAVRAQSSRESKGAIMDGLNMGIVKGLLIKVPSMDVQRRFVSVLRKVDALRSKYKVAVDDGASLNAALTSKLLAGSSQH